MNTLEHNKDPGALRERAMNRLEHNKDEGALRERVDEYVRTHESVK